VSVEGQRHAHALSGNNQNALGTAKDSTPKQVTPRTQSSTSNATKSSSVFWGLETHGTWASGKINIKHCLTRTTENLLLPRGLLSCELCLWDLVPSIEKSAWSMCWLLQGGVLADVRLFESGDTLPLGRHNAFGVTPGRYCA
jgi:hypothetical protein